MEFDESVERFGAAVGRAAGVEVGQERGSPLLEGLPESLDLGDGAGGQGGEEVLGDPPSVDGIRRVVGGAELLGAVPGDVDLVVALSSAAIARWVSTGR